MCVKCEERDDDDLGRKQFVTAAFTKWAIKTFGDYFKTYVAPAEKASDVASYINTNDVQSFNGVGGVMTDSKLIEVVNTFNKQLLLSTQDQNEIIGKIKSTKLIKTVLQTVFNRDGNKTVLGLIGYVGLPNKTGNLFHAFTVFHFINPTTVTNKQSPVCILWGIICEYKYEIKQGDKALDSAKRNSIIGYMKRTAMTSFVNDTKEDFEKINSDAQMYYRFLPADTRDELKQIDQQPQERPDNVFPMHDPFNLNDFFQSSDIDNGH